MRQFLCLLILCFTIEPVAAQLLKWTPAFIQETSSTVTITADARLGNKGLLDHTASDVFVHIGVITTQSTSASDWKYVKFTWGTSDPLAKATSSSPNQWTFTINGGLRSFFNITNSTERIQRIAILFRSGNGSKVLRNEDGSDMYVPVYDNGNFARIDEPATQPTYIRSLSVSNKKIGDTLPVTGTTNNPGDLKLFYNNKQIATAAAATTLNASIILTDPGSQKILFEATFGGNTKVSDSIQFFLPGPATIAPLPSGIGDGITYLPGDTAAYVVVYAPGKSRMAILGDFNNWTETEQSQMNKTPDGNRFWIRMGRLISGANYAYQLLVDGKLRVADYNTELVLDPSNDNSIPAATYPSIPAYPTSKTTGIVSVLQPGKVPYSWKVPQFNRPDKRNLVIYELLIRDFIANRNFKTLKDTLPYLKRLGINAIGLMPFSEFEGNLSWGYNPNFFFAVDKFYGTENALKEFIDACHQQGIAVIMDIVMNHVFGSSPLAQMYWDGTTGKPSAQNPWLNPDAKHPFNVGYDMNHESQATKDLIARVIRHWLVNYKLDGFRWDLSKGFTQTNNPNNVQAWGTYDASRISTWKRIFDSTQSVTPGSYCILEHFADNSEERELSNYGMLFWGNGNFKFNEATMGFTSNSDFGDISSMRRGWEKAHLIGYMESHDEERLMYKNLKFGNQLGSYSTRDTLTALKRMGTATAFWAMMPGPKMMWQFGELGFPYSINTCTNGTVSDNCRLDNKSPVWDFYNDIFKRGLFDVYSNLLRLRMNPSYFTTFTKDQYQLDLAGAVKSMTIDGDSLKVVVVGNFDVSNKTNAISFPADGTWYSYLTKTSINVTGKSSSIALQPGEFHVYINKDLSSTLVTAIRPTERMVLTGKAIVYPNPVQTGSILKYELKKAAIIRIDVLDAQGSTLQYLYKGMKAAGNHELPLSHMQPRSKSASVGIKFIRIQSGSESQTVKVVH